MKREYDFSRAKRPNRRTLPPIEELDRQTKVRITILLDYDVLQYFKKRAAAPGAEPYQTQINRALRECLVGKRSPGRDDLLGDEGFVARLAERVAQYSSRKKTARQGR